MARMKDKTGQATGKYTHRETVWKGILLLVSFGLLYFLSISMLEAAVAQIDIKNILRVALVLIILDLSKKAFWLLALPYVMLHAIYLPVAKSYGAMNYNYFASLIATNVAESREFLHSLSTHSLWQAAAMVPALVAFRFIAVRYNLHIARNRTALIALVLVALMSLAQYQLPRETIDAVRQTYSEIQELGRLAQKSGWTVTQVHPKYDVYVLVIGESARRDYMGAYGYPIENTPFMSTSNGVLVDGLLSAGMNTVSSLKLMLTYPNKEKWTPNYDLSFVNLANDAGFDTVWLSNQGRLGKYDTPVSAIAERSAVKHFLRNANFASSNADDDLLLPLFQQQLASISRKKKLIVLHLAGSHAIACDRLFGYRNRYQPADEKFTDVGCYLATLEKTDQLLSDVKHALDAFTERSTMTYSMIYFSDHGDSRVEVDGRVQMVHTDVRQQYQIPLFKVSSDDTARKVIKRYKSPLNFVDGIANWMGIETKQTAPQYDLFSDTADDDYGQKAKLEALPSDPPLDMRGYLKKSSG